MITKRINLYAHFNIKCKREEKGFLNAYIHANSKYYPTRTRPAVVVIAGGGYSGICERESEPVALAFFGKGYNVFTLEYSCAPIRYPSQLIEGCMAVAYVKSNATILNIDKDHVAVVGFSAGGHLAGMTATMFNEDVIKEKLGNNSYNARPDAIILGYPVISSSEFAHTDSIKNLIGDNDELREKVSLDKQVNSNSCPAFIWGTVDDDLVPSENAFLYALACKRHNVSFELHMYSHGPHGLGLANVQTATPLGRMKNSAIEDYIVPEIERWFDMALVWLKNRDFIIKD